MSQGNSPRLSSNPIALAHIVGSAILKAWGLEPEQARVVRMAIELDPAKGPVLMTMTRYITDGEAAELVRVLETYHLELDRMEPVEEA